MLASEYVSPTIVQVLIDCQFYPSHGTRPNSVCIMHPTMSDSFHRGTMLCHGIKEASDNILGGY